MSTWFGDIVSGPPAASMHPLRNSRSTQLSPPAYFHSTGVRVHPAASATPYRVHMSAHTPTGPAVWRR